MIHHSITLSHIHTSISRTVDWEVIHHESVGEFTSVAFSRTRLLTLTCSVFAHRMKSFPESVEV